MDSRLSELAASGSALVHGEALEVLRELSDGCAGLVYADPPFNTGSRRRALRTRSVASSDGHRRGFAGRTYETTMRGRRRRR